MNYREFQDLIAVYVKRTDLAALIPVWIRAAGLRIDSDCRLAVQEFRTTTPADAEYIALPLDFVEMRNIQVDYKGALALEYVTPEQLDNLTQHPLSGPPRYYTVFNNQLQLMPPGTQDSELTLELFYFAKTPQMVNDADITALLLQHETLFLYAVLVEAMPFLEYTEGQASWATMYNDMRDLLNERAAVARYSGSTLQMRAM